MSDQSDLSNTLRCEQLVYRAARHTDLGHWESLAALFVPDGKLYRPSDPQHPIVGRQAILESLRARPPRTTRHLLTNVIVELHSPTSAHISSTVTLFTAGAAKGAGAVPTQKILVGNFEDDVSLEGGDWAFICRGGSMALEFDCQGADFAVL